MIIKQEFLAQLGIKCEILLVFQGQNGVGNIYISNFVSAMQTELLKKYEIKSILSVAKGCWIQHDKDNIPYYMYLPVEDKKNFDISQHFSKCFNFIEKSREKTHILIHCRAGISRSATIIIAYLMHKFSFNLQEAYSLTLHSNPKIKPNRGFITQLLAYNKELGHPQLQYDQQENNFIPKQHNDVELSNEQVNKQQTNIKKICKKLRKIERAQQQITKHIKRIKNMIEQNTKNQRKMSDFLKTKICEFRNKIQCSN